MPLITLFASARRPLLVTTPKPLITPFFPSCAAEQPSAPSRKEVGRSVGGDSLGRRGGVCRRCQQGETRPGSSHLVGSVAPLAEV